MGLLPKNFQWQGCTTINCLSKSLNILAGDDHVPIKVGLKGTDLQYEGCTFHTWRTVQSALADLLVTTHMRHSSGRHNCSKHLRLAFGTCVLAQLNFPRTGLYLCAKHRPKLRYYRLTIRIEGSTPTWGCC